MTVPTLANSGYTLAVTCPRCGGVLRHVVSSHRATGTDSLGVAHCEPCGLSWHLAVHLRAMAAAR
jgi:transcription elongation factor Elf1